MFAFGVDIPLVEVLLAILIVAIFLLLEAIIVIGMLLKQMNKTKELTRLVQNLSETILEIKKSELAQLDKIKKK